MYVGPSPAHGAQRDLETPADQKPYRGPLVWASRVQGFGFKIQGKYAARASNPRRSLPHGYPPFPPHCRAANFPRMGSQPQHRVGHSKACHATKQALKSKPPACCKATRDQSRRTGKVQNSAQLPRRPLQHRGGAPAAHAKARQRVRGEAPLFLQLGRTILELKPVLSITVFGQVEPSSSPWFPSQNVVELV